METTRASIVWDGPERDIIMVFTEPTPPYWAVDPISDQITLFIEEVDFDEETERGRETGRAVGVEIVGFLGFEGWHDLPDLPVLWRLPGEESLLLGDLLKKKQRELRLETRTAIERH